MHPHEYLLERFEGDAVALRQRAAALRSGPPQAGPDATTSARMADACDDVVAMLRALTVPDTEREAADALMALVPMLEQRSRMVDQDASCATSRHASAPVRAVYLGAAARIREVHLRISTHVEREATASDAAPARPRGPKAP